MDGFLFARLKMDEEIKAYSLTNKIKLTEKVNAQLIHPVDSLNKYQDCEKPEQYLQIAILVEEDMTREEYLSAWPAILTMRQTLREWQGSEHIPFMHWKCSNLHKNGFTYQKIAEIINHALLIYLCQYVAELKIKEKNAPVTWPPDASARCIMGELMIKKSDYDQWITNSVKEIQDGFLPFSKKIGPIDWLRVRDVIKQYDGWLRNKSLVIKSHPKLGFEIIEDEFKERYYDLGKKLLGELENIG
jgi:hypothetical protein